MNLIIFDTETTGLKPGQICQLSYIVAQDKKIEGKNFFFKVDYIEPAAQRVHGYSVIDLQKLSGGKDFRYYHPEIAGDFSRADRVVAHNYAFDNRFMAAEFARCNSQFTCANYFCTMRHFTSICRLPGSKFPKLTELIEFLGIPEYIIKQTAEKLFGSKGLRAHDARYDATATYLCYQKGLESGYLVG